MLELGYLGAVSMLECMQSFFKLFQLLLTRSKRHDEPISVIFSFRFAVLEESLMQTDVARDSQEDDYLHFAGEDDVFGGQLNQSRWPPAHALRQAAEPQ